MCHILLILPILAFPLFWLLPWAEALTLYASICFLSAAFYWLLWGTMRQPAAMDIEGMMGGTGTIFRCGGGRMKMYYRGEIWDAVCKEAMSLGERVEIVGFDRMKLIVRRKS